MVRSLSDRSRFEDKHFLLGMDDPPKPDVHVKQGRIPQTAAVGRPALW
jgi:hypothetical protein